MKETCNFLTFNKSCSWKLKCIFIAIFSNLLITLGTKLLLVMDLCFRRTEDIRDMVVYYFYVICYRKDLIKSNRLKWRLFSHINASDTIQILGGRSQLNEF